MSKIPLRLAHLTGPAWLTGHTGQVMERGEFGAAVVTWLARTQERDMLSWLAGWLRGWSDEEVNEVWASALWGIYNLPDAYATVSADQVRVLTRRFVRTSVKFYNSKRLRRWYWQPEKDQPGDVYTRQVKCTLGEFEQVVRVVVRFGADALLQRLNKEVRQSFELQEFAGVGRTERAAMFGTTEAVEKDRVKRARETLRRVVLKLAAEHREVA